MRLPDSIERSLRQLRVTRERVALDFKRQAFADGPVSCQRACTHCCHYPLYVSILEGILVYQWLMEHRLWVQGLRDKFKEAAARTWGLNIDVWLLSNTPCPLLGDDDLCRAYSGRPLSCRTIYSCGDPHSCHPHRFHEAERIVDRKEPVKAFAEVEAAILKRLRLRRVVLPFAAAVLYGENIGRGDFDLRDVDALTMETNRPW